MSLPPQTIRVKRSRNEDPVQALYIETQHKRKKVRDVGLSPVKEYIFRLARTVENISTATPSPEPPLPPHVTDASSTFNTVLSPPTPRYPPKELVLPPLAQDHGPPSPGIPITRKGSTPSKLDTKDLVQKEPKVPLSAFSKSPAEDRRMITPVSKKTPSLKSSSSRSSLKADAREAGKRGVSPSGISKSRRRPVPIQKPRGRTTEISSKSPTIDAISPDTQSEIRRFHLSRRVRFNSGSYNSKGKKRNRGLIPVFMEGSGRVTKKRSTSRLGVESENESTSSDSEDLKEISENPIQSKTEDSSQQRQRRKPRVHPQEKALAQQKRAKSPLPVEPVTKATENVTKKDEEWDFGSDELASQLQSMVLDYISAQPGLTNLPPSTTKSPKKTSSQQKKTANRLGGGLGAGTWAELEKQMDVDTQPRQAPSGSGKLGDDLSIGMEEDDDEYVYDVYVREEVTTKVDLNELKGTGKGTVGVLVISSSDDEQWWYENAEDENDSDGKISDDEDSNAEDFHTNDYPDEESDNEIYFSSENGESEDDEGHGGGQGSLFTHGRHGGGGYNDDRHEYDLSHDQDAENDGDLDD